MRLGDLLRSARNATGKTQDEIAKEAGVPRSTVDGLERGRIKLPSPVILNRLRTVLPVTMHELIVAMGYRLDADDMEIERLLDSRDSVADALREVIDRLSSLGSDAGGAARRSDAERRSREEPDQPQRR